jgi:glycine/D-amino acid oxidase-like deaminating enzyme/nitrite reductase/ring-hydroxylating ferredoxin subunit
MRDEVLWPRAGFDAAAFPPLGGDTEVDVAIVGGGIVGLAAAHALAGSHRVAVLEALTIGGQATGRSTAKVTSQHGPIYRGLISDIGEDGARAYADANEAAIAWIVGMAGSNPETVARAEAHTWAETDAEAEDLRAEAEAARRLGLPASFGAGAGLPFPCHGLLTFANQAQINPWLFLHTLAEGLRGRAAVHEGTRVVAVEHGEPCVLRTYRHTIRARWAIVATQLPTVPEGNFFAKAYPHAHPVVAARIDGHAVPEGMYISAGSPTRSFRTARVGGEEWLAATGAPFRPGESEAQADAFANLASFLGDVFGIAPELRWVNEDFHPMDGLPFVGAATGGTPNLLVATGFDAWGITQGVVAGQILAETVDGHSHPLGPVFDASRLRPLKGAGSFVTENAKAGIQMVRDRALRSRVLPLEAIGPGRGGIVSYDGKQVAVSRDGAGRPTAVSAICTHLGCVVGWNGVDRTWDCPCHGSRFTVSGEVLAGPAVAPLEKVELPPEAWPAGAKGDG